MGSKIAWYNPRKQVKTLHHQHIALFMVLYSSYGGGAGASSHKKPCTRRRENSHKGRSRGQVPRNNYNKPRPSGPATPRLYILTCDDKAREHVATQKLAKKGHVGTPQSTQPTQSRSEHIVERQKRACALSHICISLGIKRKRGIWTARALRHALRLTFRSTSWTSRWAR